MSPIRNKKLARENLTSLKLQLDSSLYDLFFGDSGRKTTEDDKEKTTKKEKGREREREGTSEKVKEIDDVPLKIGSRRLNGE